MTPMLPFPLDDNAPADLLPAHPTREQIDRFEQMLFGLAAAQGDTNVTTQHHLVAGLYGRSIVIPAGTCLTGAPHKSEHLNVCVGDISVWTDDSGVRRLTGVHVLPARAGTKRVGFAHADTLWITIHRNDTGSNDIHTIEEALVEHPELLATRRQQAIAGREPQEALQ